MSHIVDYHGEIKCTAHTRCGTLACPKRLHPGVVFIDTKTVDLTEDCGDWTPPTPDSQTALFVAALRRQHRETSL